MSRMGSFSFFVLLILTTMAFVPLLNASYGNNREAPDEVSNEPDHGSSVGSWVESVFTANEGQWDDEFQFVAKTSFGHIGIGKGHALLDVRPLEDESGYVLGYEFLDSNRVEPEGVDELPYKSNYFYGSDRSKWVTDVSNYRSIIYRDIWDDIDLKYYFSENGLKYDFILHPGATPSDIRVRVEGQEEMIISEDQLEVLLPGNGPSIVDDDLNVFYSDDGKGIGASFTSISNDVYGFDIEDHDARREVIIDPLIYSTFIGGSSYDTSDSLDVDSNGNAYITGSTDSSNFPTTSGAYNTSKNQNSDVFVCKLNPSGSNLVYSTFIGSSSYDYGRDIIVDSSGNAFVTGSTNEISTGSNSSNSTSSDFPTTSGAYDTTHDGRADVFILKLNPSGSTLLYSTLVGSNDSEYGSGIDIDQSGNVYVIGSTFSRKFPTTEGAFSTNFSGGWETFVLKLNASGAKLIFSTFIGGNHTENPYAIKVDNSGNSYITGSTYSTDFPTTTGAYDTSHNSNTDVFLTKLNSTGKGLLYSTFIGGASVDIGYDVDVDSSGNAFVTGSTYYYNSGGGNSSSSNFPVTSGSYDRTHNGVDDCFVFKMNSAGSSLLYSTFLGGSSYDRGRGISIDSNGYAVVTGDTYSSGFPTTWGSYDTSNNGRYDVFVSRLNSNGASLNYSTFVGGSFSERGVGIHHSSDDNVIVTGYTSSSGFPTTNMSFDQSHNGVDDCFVFKMDFNVSAPPMAPRNLNGTMYSDHILLSWAHPANNGTSSLIGYKIYRLEMGGNGSGNRSAWFSYITSVGPVTSWRDFTITLGKDYYYYLIAYNSVGNSPDSNWAFVTDYYEPNFLTDGTPSTCYSGERLTFKVGAIDNVKVESVEVSYWHPGKLVRSGMMIKTDNVNWSMGIDLFLDIPNRLFYRFRAKDYYDNIIDSDQGVIVVINGRPYFFSDTTPQEGTTGEPLTFEIQVKDDSTVSEVCVEYWYGSGATENVTMTPASSDTWSHDITMEDSVQPLKYYFHAKDGSDHWNQTSIKQVDILDNDPPLLLLDETASATTTGDDLMFFVKVTDNIEVVSVSVEFWFGEGHPDNVTMEKWSEDQWRVAVSIPTDDLAELHYNFWASDPSSNILKGPEKTIQIHDDILPEILSDKTYHKAYTGSSFRFYLQVTDNIDVSEVWIEYWFEGGGRTNLSATEASDLYWELYINVPHLLNDLFYIVHVRDISRNWIASEISSSSIKDDVNPVFLEDRTPVTISTGDNLLFEVLVADNIKTRLIMVEYWFGYGDHFNVTMEGMVSHTFSIPIPIDKGDDIHYIFHAMDSSQNWNQTLVRHITMVDDDAPEITGDPTPSTGQGGGKFTVSTYVDDNIGIGKVTVEYWMDEGEHSNVTMSGSEPFRLIIDLPVGGGTLYYRFHATDVNGNTVTSVVKEVSISKSNGDPITDDDDDDDVISVEDDKIPSWGWILIVVVILIFIMTVVNILVTVMRGKGTKIVEDESGPEQIMEHPVMPQEYAPQYPQQPQEAYYQQQQPPDPQYPVPETVNQSISPEEKPPVEEPQVPPMENIPQPESVVSEQPVVQDPPEETVPIEIVHQLPEENIQGQ